MRHRFFAFIVLMAVLFLVPSCTKKVMVKSTDPENQATSEEINMPTKNPTEANMQNGPSSSPSTGVDERIA